MRNPVIPPERSLLWAVASLSLVICALCVAAACGQGAVGQPGDGLVAYWSFDEGKGNTAVNAVGARGDLLGCTGNAVASSPSWTAGKSGTAVQCNMTVGPFRPLLCRTQLTIAAWIKPVRSNRRWIFVNNGDAYRLGINAQRKNRVQFQLSLDGKWAHNWLTSRTALQPDRWYHVAAVYDGRERAIYIDGKLDARERAEGAIGVGSTFTLEAGPSRGTLDEVKIWNRALSGGQIKLAMQQDSAKVKASSIPARELFFYTTRSVASLDGDDAFKLTVFNSAAVAFEGELNIEVSSVKGQAVCNLRRRMALPARGRSDLEIPVHLKEPGTYQLSVTTEDHRLFETALYVPAPAPRQPVGPLDLKRVLSVDLTADLGPDKLCDDGTSHVVQSPAGSYREAGPKQFSRFVVRTKLKHTGLHLVRITYPDDKKRLCEITTWSPDEADHYNAHSGYFTGDPYPLSMKLQTVDFIIWARDVNHAVVFTTWQDGQPAAASRVEVFEIAGRLPASPASVGPSLRRIGQYWEDAQPLWMCFGGTSSTLAGFDEMVHNLCDYMDYAGQNVLYHPIAWYDGPIYDSLEETRIGNLGGRDLPPSGWIDILLKRFAERGFLFYGTLNVHQLPSLVAELPPDLRNAGRRGLDAAECSRIPEFSVVTSDGKVRAGTWHHRPPAFNALHPHVQDRIAALVAEAASRWGDSPAFGGISLHLTQCQLLWPSDLEASYDDWTVAQFEKDTGTRIPVVPNDPERFTKRYEWLMQNAKARWITWRCQRTAAFYARLASILRDRRDDLKLVVSLWDPMNFNVAKRWLKGERIVELTREFGIDPALLAKIPGVVIQRYMGHTDCRYQAMRYARRDQQKELQAIRRMDFDEDQLRELRTTKYFGVYFHNRYFESDIGRREPLRCDWYRSLDWRAAAIVPSNEHFMEYYAHCMAVLNPDDITVGGFTSGAAGHERQVERFASVFRALPHGDWRQIPALDEHVVGRTLTDADDHRYLYLVNPSAGAVEVLIPKEYIGSGKTEPLGDSPVLRRVDNGLAVRLEAYQLAAWVSIRHPDERR
jgi:Concanavalin A-like lectin/glucanases superfamily